MSRCTIRMLAACVVAVAASWPLRAAYQVSVKAVPVRSFQQIANLGGGAALSADGSTIAYVGADRALHVLDIAAWKDRVLVTITPSADVFFDPCFSPDGTTVVFTANGGTVHYPSDIYAINADGTDLRQLTASRRSQNDGTLDHFSKPTYSPDGLHLLVSYSERRDDRESIGVTVLMDVDGSHRTRVAGGRPVTWLEGGKAVLVAREDEFYRVVLATGEERRVEGLDGRIVGSFGDASSGVDIFALAQDAKVILVTVHEGFVEPPAPSPFALSKTRDRSSIRGRPEELQLQSVHFDKTGGRGLLYYKAQWGSDEAFDVSDVQGVGR